jgi:tripartite-type tricarboxylate transporter receptor subunit TctC
MACLHREETGMRFHSPAIVAAMLAAALSGTSGTADAQGFPNRTVTLVVAYAPGGTGDVVARIIATKLGPALGQNVVVENRAGASGGIGTQNVIRSVPDGHTILVGQTAEVAINQHLIKNLGYDPDRDLLPVALGTDVPLALCVPPKAPYNNLDELLKAARASAKGLTFASAGTGTPGHFAGELLKLRTGTNLVHVPYKGAGPALNDILGGHVDLYFSGYPAAMPHAKSGSVKVLAVSAGRRSAAAPEVPTVAELTGIKEFDLTLWQGFFVPRGTPVEVVARLNREINAILALPDVREKLLEAGADVRPMSVDEFTAFVRQQSEKYQQIIRDTGVTVD